MRNASQVFRSLIIVVALQGSLSVWSECSVESISHYVSEHEGSMGDISEQSHSKTFPNKFVDLIATDVVNSIPKNHRDGVNILFLDAGMAATEMLIMQHLIEAGISVENVAFVDAKYTERPGEVPFIADVRKIMLACGVKRMRFLNAYFSSRSANNVLDWLKRSDTKPVNLVIGIHVQLMFPVENLLKSKQEMPKVYGAAKLKNATTLLYHFEPQDKVLKSEFLFGPDFREKAQSERKRLN